MAMNWRPGEGGVPDTVRLSAKVYTGTEASGRRRLNSVLSDQSTNPNHLQGFLKQGLLGSGLLGNLEASVQSENVGPLVEKLNEAQHLSKWGACTVPPTT